jgi:hypothetical protein
MPVSKATPWLVDGFALDGPPPTNRLKKALTEKYNFSVHEGGGARTHVQTNVAFVFHYVYFFRDLYAYDAQVLKAAAEDLGIADSYQCEGIFRRYLDAREKYTSDPNNVHIPAEAQELDMMLCGIVDHVIALMPVEREMSEQQLHGKIAARRKDWKMVVKKWMMRRIAKEPFFPNSNNLLVQLMEMAEAARDATDTQSSSPDATIQALAGILEDIGEGNANQDAADNDQMNTESDEVTSLQADVAIDHQLYAAIDPNSTPTVAQELIPIQPPYDWRLTDLITLNIIGAWREPAQQVAQHLDAVARDSRNPWRTRFFHWMMARSLCEFIRWCDRFAVDARQHEHEE